MHMSSPRLRPTLDAFSLSSRKGREEKRVLRQRAGASCASQSPSAVGELFPAASGRSRGEFLGPWFPSSYRLSSLAWKMLTLIFAFICLVLSGHAARDFSFLPKRPRRAFWWAEPPAMALWLPGSKAGDWCTNSEFSLHTKKKKSPKGLNRACVGAVVFLLAAVGGGSLRLNNNEERKWVSGIFW